MLKAKRIYADLNQAEIAVGLEVAEVGLGKVDYEKDVVILDHLAADLFDLSANQEISRKDFHARIHPEDWPLVEREVDILLAPAEPDVIDVTHRIVTSDGKTRWINARKQVFFAAGKRKIRPLTGVFAVVDISLRKQAEIKAEYLIGELNHRTKNLITVASSIVRQIERHSGSDDLGQKIVDRLGALARNQDAMLQTSSGVVDLVSVLEQEVQAISGTDSDRISMSGPKIKLTNETGQIIAMITHELVTNAAKYGALSTAVGNINLEWKVTEAQEFSFYWSELGGPNVEKPIRSGFGTQMLITYVQAALGGEASLEYHASGLKYVLTAPAERLLA